MAFTVSVFYSSNQDERRKDDAAALGKDASLSDAAESNSKEATGSSAGGKTEDSPKDSKSNGAATTEEKME